MPNVRIRYSLLTLLVLTALVAGGVKLWYGPHHVVERVEKEQMEKEYTYFLDWRGNKILHGLYVTRGYGHRYPALYIDYYRDGTLVNWHFSSFFDGGEQSRANTPVQSDSPLSPTEWQMFREAVELEKLRAYPPGVKTRDDEGTVVHF